VAVKRGAIVHGDWRYQLTDEDLLWAGRMVQGETLPGRARRGEDALAVLWTMTSLFTPAGQRAKYGRLRFGTFTDLIRAYSQPINPRWLRDGFFCRPGGRHHGTDACAPERLDGRERLQRMAWSELDAELRAVVLRWAAGQTTNPAPRAIEFAAPYVARAFLERHPDARRVTTIHNQFIATARSWGWATLPSVVAREGAAAARGSAAGIALFGVAAFGGLLGWGLSRRRSAEQRVRSRRRRR